MEKVLSYSAKGAFHSPRYKRYLKYRAIERNAKIMGTSKRPDIIALLARLKPGVWDGRVKFFSFDGKNYTFPTTLLPLVRSLVSTKIIRTYPKPPNQEHDFFWVGRPKRSTADYSYQDECIELVSKHRFGIFHLAPSAGKSEIIAGVIEKLGVTTVCSTPSIETAFNLYNRLSKYFPAQVGLWAGSYKCRLMPINVVCWPSLRNNKAAIASFATADLWIADECHAEIAAATRFSKLSQSYWRFGFSATISKAKAKSLPIQAVFGPELRRINERELEKRKVSSPAKHVFLKYRNPGTFEPEYEKQPYHRFYRRWVVQNHHRNMKGVEIVVNEVKEKHRGLVFVRQRKHGKILRNMLEGKGVKCQYIHGTVSSSIRQKAQNKLRDGTIDVLIGTTIIATGISINEVQFTVSMIGEKSITRIKQQVGRGARFMEGKNTTNYEMYDDFSQRLLKHTRKRIRVLKSTGCKVETRE